MIQNYWFFRFPNSRRGRVYILWFLLLWLVILAGPFTTYPLLPLDIRIVYWMILFWGAMPVGCALERLIGLLAPHLPRVAATLALPFVMATLYGLFVAGVTWVFGWFGYPLNLPFWLIWCGVFLSTVAVQAGNRLIETPRQDISASHAPSLGEAAPEIASEGGRIET
ncbi:hypothetical protein FGG78_36965, partial [Thioclava sp. BHET1]